MLRRFSIPGKTNRQGYNLLFHCAPVCVYFFIVVGNAVCLTKVCQAKLS